MATLTPIRRIERAHIQLMRSNQFCLLSGIMLMGESTVDEGTFTAYTDGVNKRYGAEFIKPLREKQLNFVVAHENFHVMLKHITTWRVLWEKDKECANKAADYVINLMIRNLDPDGKVVSVLDCALIDDMFLGWDTSRVFDYLYREKQKRGGGEGGGENRPDSFDEHGWEQAKELSKQEVTDLENAIDEAVRQGGILASKKGNANAKQLVGELTRPTLDWRALLQEFISNVCAGRDSSSWRRPNRRWLAQDIYLPSPISETIGPIAIFIDMSGSVWVTPKIINIFLSHVKLITETVTPDKIYIVYWDTETYEPEIYEPAQFDMIPQSTKPVGGGGTDPACIKEWLHKVTDVTFSTVLVLTDGYICGDFPDFGIPTLWGITTDVVATHGVTVKVTE